MMNDNDYDFFLNTIEMINVIGIINYFNTGAGEIIN